MSTTDNADSSTADSLANVLPETRTLEAQRLRRTGPSGGASADIEVAPMIFLEIDRWNYLRSSVRAAGVSSHKTFTITQRPLKRPTWR